MQETKTSSQAWNAAKTVFFWTGVGALGGFGGAAICTAVIGNTLGRQTILDYVNQNGPECKSQMQAYNDGEEYPFVSQHCTEIFHGADHAYNTEVLPKMIGADIACMALGAGIGFFYGLKEAYKNSNCAKTIETGNINTHTRPGYGSTNE